MPPDSSLHPSATRARSELKHVELARWQTLMLVRLAAREHSDPGDYLSRHLLDLAACESEFLSAEIPGFLEAVRWPDVGRVWASGVRGKRVGLRRRRIIRQKRRFWIWRCE